MVIGRGLLAHAFAEFESDDQVLVFASGVSNSGELDNAAYAREMDLLQEQRGRSGRLVYFSTCGLFDPVQRSSRYIMHKQEMERRVRDAFADHLILRLPNLVGRTNNPHTLVNFLRDRIVRNEPFDLHVNACRYLMDVDDVVADCAPMFQDPHLRGTTVNVCPDVPIALPELVAIMEDVLGHKADARRVQQGSCYAVDNRVYQDHRRSSGRGPWPEDHVRALLSKYLRPD